MRKQNEINYNGMWPRNNLRLNAWIRKDILRDYEKKNTREIMKLMNTMIRNGI